MSPARAFEILELKPGAAPDDIRQAYLDLVQVWHPDRFTGNERMHSIAEEKLRDINVAYRVLQSVPPEAPPTTENRATAPTSAPPSPQTSTVSASSVSVSSTMSGWIAALEDPVWLRRVSLRLAGFAVILVLIALIATKLFDRPRGGLQTADDNTSGAEPARNGTSVIGRKNQTSRASHQNPEAPPIDDGTPASQGLILGNEGEIVVHNETGLDGNLALSWSSAPSRPLKSSPLPSDGGTVLRGLSPESYVLDVTFVRYPGAPVHLGPFVIVRTITSKGAMSDRYEVHIKPRSNP